jgi:hypothetical protein
MNGSAAGVGKQFTQGHWFAQSYWVGGEFPSGKKLVNVHIQRDLALLDQPKRRHGCQGLADGAALKHSLGCHRRSTDTADAKPACPLDLALMNYCDAYPGNFKVLPSISEHVGGVIIALDDYIAGQS